MAQQDIKSGFQTSEFALTAGTAISGFLVLLGYLPTDKADEFVQAIVSVVGGLIVIVSTVTYILARIKLKQQAQQTPLTPAAPATPVSDKLEGLSNDPAVYPK